MYKLLNQKNITTKTETNPDAAKILDKWYINV
jgi:uncharacterized protein YjaZ